MHVIHLIIVCVFSGLELTLSPNGLHAEQVDGPWESALKTLSECS